MIIKKRKKLIFSSISSREITKNMVKVKSSNIWSYTLDLKDNHSDSGNLYVQFKNQSGGPGDVYVYYDVPVVIYRRWQSSPSKGHYFWQYIRNYYRYSKLTGDKRGKLKNAVN